MKNMALASTAAGFGPLAFLSIQHTPPGTVPEAFSNEERVRAFRNALPVEIVNAYQWPFRELAEGLIEG